MKGKILLSVFVAGLLVGGTKAFAQVEGELSPEEETRLIQEFSRMLAEDIGN